jgi:oligopeptidase A
MGRAAAGASAAPDLPKWSSITPEHIRPAIAGAVEAATAEIDTIEVRRARS